MPRRWKMTCLVLLIGLPAFVFYFILSRTAVSLPILDDYEIILGTANALHQTHGLVSHAAIVLTNEHNGYKLVFENGVIWALYGLTGHVFMVPLVFLGDAFALAIFLIVALMAKNIDVDVLGWLAILVPVAYFVFQLQYASALNFASSSLQHLAVVAFSLLAIYCMSRETQGAFVAGCAATILSVASSPNGFFLAPIGLLLLGQRRQWKRAGCWIGLLAGLLGIYLYHYIPGVSGASPGANSSLSVSHRINFLYALSFIGSSAARYSSVFPSLLLGSLLFALLVWATTRRYFLRNPAVFYSMLFIFINGIALSALRPELGVVQSLASRYRTYSNLMLALSYLFLIESFLPQISSQRMRRAAIGAAILVSMLFCALSDVGGARFLWNKKQALIASYRSTWQHAASGNDAISSSEMEANPALKKQVQDGVYNVNLPIMRESVRLGVYQPPPQ